MQKTLKEIAGLINGEIVGDERVLISGVCGIKEADEGDLTFLANPKYASFIAKTRASAIITSLEVENAPKPIIRTENPSLAFARVVSFFTPQDKKLAEGIHPTALLGKGVSLGKKVSIGAYAVLEDNVSIGDNVVLYPHCFIGHDTTIGKDTLVHSNVSVRERTSIGERVVIHNGSVIGSDGFGYATIQGVHQRIPQIGIVVIEDDVDIGANVTIDRARFDKTVIGKGTKIDNLVQIAHNVIIGEHSIVVAQVGISGSTVIGKNVTIAGQAGLVGHITVGDGAVLAGQAGVTKSVPANTTVSGYPAKPHSTALRINACIQKLPELFAKVEELKKELQELKKDSGGKT